MNSQYRLLAGLALMAVIACSLTETNALAQETTPMSTDRIFEIRTYTCEPSKLDALLSRFRDHTAELFEKHGIENIAYWTPADEPRSSDTLIYVVAHPSREAAKKNWDAFVNDPAWQKARDESEAGGKIVNKIESIYMNPTDFSPLK
jgi:hypothetical protein